MKKKIVPVIAALVLILVVAVIGIAAKIIEKYTPSDERMSLSEYYDIQDESELALIFQDEVAEYKGLLEGDTAYIDLEAVKDYLNSCFYWDADNQVCILTTPVEMIRIKDGAKKYTMSGEKQTVDYEIMKMIGDKAYLAAEFVQKFTNMEFKVEKDPNRMIITYKWGKQMYARIQKDTSVRYQGGIKSPILEDVIKGDEVVILEEMEDWTKVVTESGYIGYVQNKYLTDNEEKEINRDFEEPVYTTVRRDHKINLVWHQITNTDSNTTLSDDIADLKGVNVISPTWYSIADNEGNLTSLADSEYVKTAHKNGMEVWALVDNFSQDIDFTKVVNSTAARAKIIKQLIGEASDYGIDGINIDFETIPEEAADGYIQFIRELSVKCRRKELVLSVDNPVPQPFTAHYNRKVQGVVADYVIIMGYDEHYDGSEAGSVASMPFVKTGIEDTLNEVPKEKVINAVPFYARLWKTTVLENGASELTSEAVGMDYADSILKEHGVSASWDASALQDYAKFKDEDGSSYEIWLENEKSIEEKAKLINEYELGGIAAWKLGLERTDIWDVILKYVS